MKLLCCARNCSGSAEGGRGNEAFEGFVEGGDGEAEACVEETARDGAAAVEERFGVHASEPCGGFGDGGGGAGAPWAGVGAAEGGHEVGVADRVGGGGDDGAVEGSVLEGEEDGFDGVVGVDPADPLVA